MSITDDVILAQGGDAAAFARLVDRFEPAARAYALGWLRDPDAAEDAVQDALIESHLRLGQLRTPAAFPGWLRRVVLKHCDRQTRRPRRRVEAEAESETSRGAEARLEQAEVEAGLRAGVEALPPHERVAVALHYFGELEQAEVAAFLEISTEAVKKRLSRARSRLARTGLEPPPRSARAGASDPVRLHLALRAGDREGVDAVLDRRPDLLEAPEQWPAEAALAVGFPLAHRNTPLVLTAARGDLALVEHLLARGASADAPCGCPAGDAPLFAAALHGRAAVVDRLLVAGADPDRGNDRGWRPLHLAAARGDEALFDRLVAGGADPSLSTADGVTAASLRAHPPAPRPRRAPVRPGERIETGIAAIDLLAPLARGMRVRVHGAAETGLMVLLTELSWRLARQGLHPVWASWTPRPWFRGELETIARGGGLAARVEVDGLAALLERDLADAAVIAFAQEGHEAELEAHLPLLARAVDRGGAALVVVVEPWIPVTRDGRPPPRLAPPYDAIVATDPRLARAGVYPAPDLVATRSTAALPVSERALVDAARARADDPEIWAAFAQPFFTVVHQTGRPGEDRPRGAAIRRLARALERPGPR